MDSSITQIGIGGIFAILIIKEVLSFVKGFRNGKKNGENEAIKLLYEILDYCKKVHIMHDIKDSDGTYIWYVKRSLEVAINKLAENINHQTECFRDLVHELRKK